jgi:hypothetical protein
MSSPSEPLFSYVSASMVTLRRLVSQRRTRALHWCTIPLSRQEFTFQSANLENERGREGCVLVALLCKICIFCLRECLHDCAQKAINRARKVLGWPKRCRLAMHSCGSTAIKAVQLAQLLGQLGVFLTEGLNTKHYEFLKYMRRRYPGVYNTIASSKFKCFKVCCVCTSWVVTSL